MASVALGKDTSSGELVILDQEERFQGLYIIGVTGSGKSTLLQNMILQDIHQGYGVCVLDPKGQLVQDVLLHIPSYRQDDLVLLDPLWPGRSFGLNIFECNDPDHTYLVDRLVSQFMGIAERVWDVTRQTPRLAQYLRSSAMTLVLNKQYTMAEISLLLTESWFRSKLLANIDNNDLQRFWSRHEQLPRQEQLFYGDSTYTRVEELLLQRTLKRIVGQSRSTVDFRQLLDASKIILVPMPVGLLGPQLVRLLGSLVVALLKNAILSRADIPEKDRQPFNLYADEYWYYSTTDFAEILTQSRSFKVATTIAHQERSQLDWDNPVGVNQVASKIVFRVGHDDAESLAGVFDPTPRPPADPNRTVAPNPVQRLLHEGHNDESVRSECIPWLQALITTSTMPESDDYIPMVFGYDTYYTLKANLLRGIQLLNQYLVNIMSSRYPAYSDRATALAEILIELRAYIGFAPEGAYPSQGLRQTRYEYDHVALPALSAQRLKELLDPTTALDNVRERIQLLLGARAEYWRNQRLEHDWKSSFSGTAEGRKTYTDDQAIARAERELIRFHAAYQVLEKLSTILAQTPILSVTDPPGWQHSQQTHADRKIEIAGIISRQPDYIARYKVKQGAGLVEGSLQTFAPGLIAVHRKIHWFLTELKDQAQLPPQLVRLFTVALETKDEDTEDGVLRVPLPPTHAQILAGYLSAYTYQLDSLQAGLTDVGGYLRNMTEGKMFRDDSVPGSGKIGEVRLSSKKVTSGSMEEALDIGYAVQRLRGAIPWAPQVWYRQEQGDWCEWLLSNDMQLSLIRFVHHFLQSWKPGDYYLGPELAHFKEAREHDWLGFWVNCFDENPSEQVKQMLQQRAQAECQALISFLEELITVRQHLLSNGIIVCDEGGWQIDYTSVLADNDYKRIEHMKLSSIERYTRKHEDIDREIAERQRGPDDSPPSTSRSVQSSKDTTVSQTDPGNEPPRISRSVQR